MAKFNPVTITGGYATTTALNSNFSSLSTVLENMLSRDGSTPNSMLANLDMNSKRIINLPEPVANTDAARLQDVLNVVTQTISETVQVSDVVKARGSIADLKAYDVTGLQTGDIILVTGYNAHGDCMPSHFRYVSTSTTTADDAMVIAPNAGSGRWFRVHSGVIDLKWFGAVGDGVTDDTAKIEAAHTWVENNTGNTLYIPKGTFMIDPDISETYSGGGFMHVSNNNYMGAGVGIAIFKCFARTGSYPHIFAGSGLQNSKISGWSLDCNNCKTNGIGYANAFSAHVDKVWIGELEVYGAKKDTTRVNYQAGGKGFTCQFGIRRVFIDKVVAKDCFIGVGFEGDYENSQVELGYRTASGMLISNIHCEDCNIGLFGLGKDPTKVDATLKNQSETRVRIDNVFLKNCGKSEHDVAFTAVKINTGKRPTINTWVSDVSSYNLDWLWVDTGNVDTSGYAEWNSGTTYAVNDNVKITHNNLLGAPIGLVNVGNLSVGTVVIENDDGVEVGAVIRGVMQHTHFEHISVNGLFEHLVLIDELPSLQPAWFTTRTNFCEGLTIGTWDLSRATVISKNLCEINLPEAGQTDAQSSRNMNLGVIKMRDENLTGANFFNSDVVTYNEYDYACILSIVDKKRGGVVFPTTFQTAYIIGKDLITNGSWLGAPNTDAFKEFHNSSIFYEYENDSSTTGGRPILRLKSGNSNFNQEGEADFFVKGGDTLRVNKHIGAVGSGGATSNHLILGDGHFYKDSLRLYFKNDSLITITNITRANPAVATYTPATNQADNHPSNGQRVRIQSVSSGMTELNGVIVKANNVDTVNNTFVVQYLNNVNINSSSFNTWVNNATGQIDGHPSFGSAGDLVLTVRGETSTEPYGNNNSAYRHQIIYDTNTKYWYAATTIGTNNWRQIGHRKRETYGLYNFNSTGNAPVRRMIPAGSIITAAYLTPTTNFVGGTNISVGGWHLNNTPINNQGLFNNIAIADLTTNNFHVCSGGFLNTRLANDTYLVMTVNGAGSEGQFELLVEYIIPNAG